MPYKLVELATGKFLTENSEPKNMGGPYGEGLRNGTLAWIIMPDGVPPNELLFVNGVIIGDEAKKAARELLTQARAERGARLKLADLDKATTLAALKPILKDILAALTEDL